MIWSEGIENYLN